MSLSANAKRELLHERRITIRGYRRDDGLYDIEGHLSDTKTHDIPLAAGIRFSGQPIHSMWLRLTIDLALNIVDAEAASDAVPYAGYCDEINASYKKLIGLTIRSGFSGNVRDLLGGTRGCTHMTELVDTVATAAFQTIAFEHKPADSNAHFQLDKCHALAAEGEVVAKYYPRWHKVKE